MFRPDFRSRFAVQQCVTRCRRSIARTTGRFRGRSASPYTLAPFDGRSIVDFNDTPTEAAFRQEVRAFLDTHAPLRKDPTDTAFVEGRDDGEAVEDREGVASHLVRRGLGVSQLAEGIRRPRRRADRARDLESGSQPLRDARRLLRDRPGHVRTDADGLRDRRTETPLPAGVGARRRHLVSAVQRTGRGLRPRRHQDPRRARRRRLGVERPEDLDQRRALLRLRHHRDAHRSERAEAQRADDVLHRHEEPRHRDPPDQTDQRRSRVQRSVLHQRARARQPAPRRGRQRVGRCRS